MITLERTNSIQNHLKRKNNGPVEGGRFWALKDANDLPSIDESISVAAAIESGELWMKNVDETSWVKIHNISDIPSFNKEYRDNYHNCTIDIVVTPYMPEFYHNKYPLYCPMCDGVGVLPDNQVCPVCDGKPEILKGE